RTRNRVQPWRRHMRLQPTSNPRIPHRQTCLRVDAKIHEHKTEQNDAQSTNKSSATNTTATYAASTSTQHTPPHTPTAQKYTNSSPTPKAATPTADQTAASHTEPATSAAPTWTSTPGTHSCSNRQNQRRPDIPTDAGGNPRGGCPTPTTWP